MADLDTLVGLWQGDDLTTGYQHPELVIAVCEQVQPANRSTVLRLLYPDTAPGEVDEFARRIVAEGFRVWKLRHASLAEVT